MYPFVGGLCFTSFVEFLFALRVTSLAYVREMGKRLEYEMNDSLKGVNLVVMPAGVPRKPGMTCDDLFNINTDTVKTLVEVVAARMPSFTLLAIQSTPQCQLQLKSARANCEDSESGTEVVEAKAGAGSATLSVAYAAACFVESSLCALHGDSDVNECCYVQSDLTYLPFFASRVKLGKHGVEALITLDLQGLTEYEQKALEALEQSLRPALRRA
ncbi:unnamed protein product [Fraxinus pennsylvanica]|uniref:malate dehydrogenase n=1 Tax=Fraxinus pennsylvanica TaxID=56036 RepID=A0AAD1YQ60_9LAMI|nr:unnamed protein product [Fraxinus pennsylvanica]